MPMTPEEKKAANKQYYQENKERILARRKQYYEQNKERENANAREYREENKERILADKKKWYENNKERETARVKQYYEANKDKTLARQKKYREENPEEWHRSHRIGQWKYNGVIHDDYDALYDQYMATTNCADCDVVLGKIGDGTGTFKCLDHCHDTGAFRAVVCNTCNLQRGRVDRKLKLEAQSP